jgi:glutamyl-tRNA synthetase
VTVRTRFAPSPTGFLHVGGARTALFCWLYARRMGGQFILRIEDTDRERSTQASVDAILESMDWLGLDYDEGPIYQTDRFPRYAEVIERLLAEDKAYRCYCSRERLEALRAEQMQQKIKPRYDGHCAARTDPLGPDENPVIRFRNPTSGNVVFEDAVRGPVTISNDELDDLIIARGDGTPTYNFTVVVDDLDMAITHVIRGDDHVNNTPRQINILHALGGQAPIYGHVPMILGPDGQRLSKRHGAVGVMQFKEDGFLPDALLNYLVRLGWSHGDQEIFSREQMISLFDISDANRSASTFDTEKLMWLNQHYIKEGPDEVTVEAFTERLQAAGLDLDQGPSAARVFNALRERAKTLVEMASSSRYFFEEFDEYEGNSAQKHLRPVVREHLATLRARLADLDVWQASTIHDSIEKVAEEAEIKIGKLGQPVRVAVCGRGVSPPFDITLELVGKGRTLARLDKALAFIDARAQN